MDNNSNDIMIKANGISKCYRIGLKEDIHTDFTVAALEFLKSPLKNYRKYRSLYRFDDIDPDSVDTVDNNNDSDILWALRNITFEVKRGEVIGFIGKNGAGKSTLLKILSRITSPTSGRIEIRGKVASLLEVGTGFHPELTGRENVYLNGTILGMTKKEVAGKFDEIVDFSGIHRFIDTPVKRYSSGMAVRLAFSVAAHLDPEILIIDEVLAVGDAEFQKKCLGKMKNVASEGRTVLFVSHNMAAVSSLCQKAILIENGAMTETGSAQEVVAKYMQSANQTSMVQLGDRTDRVGNQEVKFTAFELRDGLGHPVQCVFSGQDISIALHYESKMGKAIKSASVYIIVHGKFDEILFQLSSSVTGADFKNLPPRGAFICSVPKLPLQPGAYQTSLYCKVDTEDADWVPSAGTFTVESGDFFGSGKLPGSDKGYHLVDHSWRTE